MAHITFLTADNKEFTLKKDYISTWNAIMPAVEMMDGEGGDAKEDDMFPLANVESREFERIVAFFTEVVGLSNEEFGIQQEELMKKFIPENWDEVDLLQKALQFLGDDKFFELIVDYTAQVLEGKSTRQIAEMFNISMPSDEVLFKQLDEALEEAKKRG